MMAHPFVPFITEEIWLNVGPRARAEGETVMLQPFPQFREDCHDQDAEDEIAWVMQFILGIRQIRGEMDISPGKPLPVLLQGADAMDVELAGRSGHPAGQDEANR